MLLVRRIYEENEELPEKEDEEFKQLVKANKGSAFSTEGICTLERFWRNYIIYIFVVRLIGVFLRFFFSLSLEDGGLIKFISKEPFLSLAIYFWCIIIYSSFTIYIGFLKIKRLRSLGFNPWGVLIPIFSDFAIKCIPCKKDFQNYKYFKGKIKYKPLLIYIMVIFQLLFSIILLVLPLNPFIYFI